MTTVFSSAFARSVSPLVSVDSRLRQVLLGIGSHTVSLLSEAGALVCDVEDGEISLRFSTEPTALVLGAASHIWERVFEDPHKVLIRSLREGEVQIEGDRAGVMFRWRLVFAIVEAIGSATAKERHAL